MAMAPDVGVWRNEFSSTFAITRRSKDRSHAGGTDRGGQPSEHCGRNSVKSGCASLPRPSRAKLRGRSPP
jgi:hypothetical protein